MKEVEWSMWQERAHGAKKSGKIKLRYDSENVPFHLVDFLSEKSTFFAVKLILSLVPFEEKRREGRKKRKHNHTPARDAHIFLKFLFAHERNFFLRLLCAREFTEIIVPITFRCLFNLYASCNDIFRSLELVVGFDRVFFLHRFLKFHLLRCIFRN